MWVERCYKIGVCHTGSISGMVMVLLWLCSFCQLGCLYTCNTQWVKGMNRLAEWHLPTATKLYQALRELQHCCFTVPCSALYCWPVQRHADVNPQCVAQLVAASTKLVQQGWCTVSMLTSSRGGFHSAAVHMFYGAFTPSHRTLRTPGHW